MYVDAEPLAFSPNQIVASKWTVSGKGSLILPFKIPGDPGDYDCIRTETIFQDNKVDGSLISSLNYTVFDEFGNRQQASSYPYYLNVYTGSSTYFCVNNTVQYYYNIDFEYENGRQEVLVVRPSCTPSTPRTYLHAYSTDLDYANVPWLFKDLAFYLSKTPLWNTYAYVRLDMKNEDDIHYFKDLKAYNQSLYSNPPDPSLGYMDTTTGSDMFSVIRKFLKNTEFLCGSRIVIHAKRYPNEVEIEELISDLQKNHVFVYILSSDTPNGGSNPSAMFNVATRTNGYCVFSQDGALNRLYSYPYEKPVASEPNQIAAQKFAVSGKGSVTVPYKTQSLIDSPNHVHYEFIFQDHKMDGSLTSLYSTVTDEFGTQLKRHSGYMEKQFTAYYYDVDVNNTVQYYLNIYYEYQAGRQEVMVVRIHSGSYVPDYWLPFNN